MYRGKDYTNKKIGKLTVVGLSDKTIRHSKNNKYRLSLWECTCTCGNTCYKAAGTLQHSMNSDNPVLCCDACKKKRKSNAVKDLTGKIFGTWEVLKYIKSDRQKYSNWRCRCIGCDTIEIKATSALWQAKKYNSTCKKCSYENLKVGIRALAVNNVLANIRTYKTGKKSKTDLTTQEVDDLIFKSCFYCGSVPNNKFIKIYTYGAKDEIYRHGIDRVDSNKGYIKGNMVTCCEKCNKMKLDHTKEDFIKHAKLIAEHNK